ncbi:type II secretion system F family protein [bacterium]|nr:MAG: type II secretion system F family protein [bacterium]
MQLLIAILGALSAFLFALSLVPVKSPLAERLEALRLAGAANSGGTLAARTFDVIFSAERRGRLAQRLAEAGWYNVSPLQMGLRVLGGGCLGAIAGIVAFRPLLQQVPFVLAIVVGALLCLAGAYAPVTMLNRAVDERKVSIQRTLPDFLDMVSTTVEAGLSLNAALAYAVDAAPGALGSEIREALSEIRLGRARGEALKAAARRANVEEFSTTITALVQAERMGSNVAAVLSEVAEDTRNRRLMVLEEHAAKLPVKMTIPMAAFLLPAVFTVIFGSVIANYFASR